MTYKQKSVCKMIFETVIITVICQGKEPWSIVRAIDYTFSSLQQTRKFFCTSSWEIIGWNYAGDAVSGSKGVC